MEVGNIVPWGCGEDLTEMADGFLGDHEFDGHLHLVVNEDDGLAKAVDLGDVGDVDDEAAPEALETDVAYGLSYLHEVVETGEEGEGASALELDGDVVAVADGVHHVVEAYFCEFVTCVQVNVVCFVAHLFEVMRF